MGEIAQRLGVSKTMRQKQPRGPQPCHRGSGRSRRTEFGISPQRVSQIMLALWAADRINGP